MYGPNKIFFNCQKFGPLTRDYLYVSNSNVDLKDINMKTKKLNQDRFFSYFICEMYFSADIFLPVYLIRKSIIAFPVFNWFCDPNLSDTFYAEQTLYSYLTLMLHIVLH